jgi:hypothetical protein
MHDFGDVDLKGKKVVVKQIGFYKPKATAKERTFLCKGGPGCTALPSGSRRITGRWLSDNAADDIDSYSIQAILEGK